MTSDHGQNNRCFSMTGSYVRQSLEEQIWQDQGNRLEWGQRHETITCLLVTRFWVRAGGKMVWDDRMVGSIMTKEVLQELGRHVGFTLGALCVWVFSQSEAEWERGGNRCTLETSGSASVWVMKPLPRVSADFLINWTLGARMELEDDIPGWLHWPGVSNGLQLSV